MSTKRDSMTRKRPTQVELEREVSELKRENQKLRKRLKQAVRQINKEHDADVDAQVALDLEQESTFNDMLERVHEPEKDPNEGYLVITLPNGVTKRLKKRIPENE